MSKFQTRRVERFEAYVLPVPGPSIIEVQFISAVNRAVVRSRLFEFDPYARVPKLAHRAKIDLSKAGI